METVDSDQDSLLQNEEIENEGEELLEEVAQEPEWEAPSWSKSWKEEARNGLSTIYKSAVANNPELKTHWEKLQSELDNTYSYSGRRDKEYAEYRKRADPILSIADRYEPRFSLNGMSFDQGVNQLFSIAEFLGQSPDQALPYLGNTYRPNDVSGTLRALAQTWGADLSQLVQDEPYVDPTVQGLMNPLAQRLAQIEQRFQQTDQERTQQARSEVAGRLQAFETAVDESGKTKYPYFRDVFESHMLPAIKAGFARDLTDAYEFAVRNHPEISKQYAQEITNQAKTEAIKNSSVRNQQTEQAKRASRNISGKTKGSAEKGMTFEDAVADYYSQFE